MGMFQYGVDRLDPPVWYNPKRNTGWTGFYDPSSHLKASDEESSPTAESSWPPSEEESSLEAESSSESYDKSKSDTNIEVNMGSAPSHTSTPPSAQPPRVDDGMRLLYREVTPEWGDFDLRDFTQEEIDNYNAMAEPGQRLQDAVTPNRMRALMQDISSKLYAFTAPRISTLT